MPAPPTPGEGQGASPLTSMVLGGIAGSIAEMVTMPAIVVRTRLMVQGASTSGEAVQYRGFLDAVKVMMRNEGVGAFYKGGAINALITPGARGLFTLGMETSRTYVGEGTALQDFAAGTAGQLFSSLAYVPRDVVVERCAIDGQLSSQVGSSASSIKVLATIFRHEGLMGFYRAYLPHQLVWIPFNGLLLTFLGRGKEAGVALGVRDTSSPSFGVANTLVCSSAAAWLTTPIDVVKTRIQVSGANPELFAYSGPIDCAVKTVKGEGIAALFAGASGRVFYLGPAMALFFPIYDALKSAFAS